MLLLPECAFKGMVYAWSASSPPCEAHRARVPGLRAEGGRPRGRRWGGSGCAGLEGEATVSVASSPRGALVCVEDAGWGGDVWKRRVSVAELRGASWGRLTEGGRQPRGEGGRGAGTELPGDAVPPGAASAHPAGAPGRGS